LQGTTQSILEAHWGDIASVVGVFISLIGFAITIWNVIRSKNAAQKAREAVDNVRETILRSDTIVDFSAVITTMEEIKRLHRTGNWIILPDRYSSLKRKLVKIRSTNPDLSDDYKTALQNAIQHFSNIEQKVERALASKKSPPNVAKLNEIVSAQLDTLNEVLTAIMRDVRMEGYGDAKIRNTDSKTK
jgi:hypothetical protein